MWRYHLSAFSILITACSLVMAALPPSGPITMSQVAVELGRSSTASTSLGETAVRILADKPSGAVSMSDLYGKTAGGIAAFTINSVCTTSSAAGACGIEVVFNGTLTAYAIGSGNTVTTPAPPGWYVPITGSNPGAFFWAIVTPTAGSFNGQNNFSSCATLDTAHSYLNILGFGSVTFTFSIYSDPGCTVLVYQKTGNTITQL